MGNSAAHLLVPCCTLIRGADACTTCMPRLQYRAQAQLQTKLGIES